MPPFVRYACWQRPSSSLLKTEALEGNEAAFLATHTPIEGFQVSGSRRADVSEPTEQGLLNAIANYSDLRHTFCVIEGEPGSGKSHLIRWLKIHWRQDDDLVLLIQREDGSLEGTLRQLRERLPEEFKHLLQGIGTSRQATLEGRARDFQAMLANALLPDHFEKPMPDADWCAGHRLEAILNAPEARDRWEAPKRILHLVSGAPGSERNSELGRFVLGDAVQLAGLRRHLRALPPPALTFMRRLEREAPAIEAERERQTAEAEIRARLGSAIECSVSLIDGLNARTNHALRSLLGISERALRDLFREIRQRLAQVGRRLVLFLEDITSFQGIDEQLVDALVTQSDTREAGDLCDLISVVGITPSYYVDKLEALGNVVQRITHHIRLGERTHAGRFQELMTLRDADERLRFAARYLRAVRAGKDSLDAWYQEARTHSGVPVPNACSSCSEREACHAAFGKVDLEGNEAVGLYPFNARAVNGLFEALRDQGMLLQTPRGMLQGVLSPTLMDPEAVGEGAYPSAAVETSWVEAPPLPGAFEQVVTNRVQGDDQSRYRRLVNWWGTGHDETVIRDGIVEHAGLSRGVFEALVLPWLGDDEPAIPEGVPEGAPVGEDASPAAPAEANETRDAEHGQSATPGTAQTSPAGTQEDTRRRTKEALKTRPTRQRVRAGEREKRVTSLRAWLSGDPLDDAPFWRKLLGEVIDALPLHLRGVPLALRERLLTAQLVVLEGEGGAHRSERYLRVPRANWVADGLEAVVALRSTETTERERSFYQRRAGQFLRRLVPLARFHIESRIPDASDGGRWRPATTATEVLLARAWLRGTSRPTDPLHIQWRAIWAEEEVATTSPDSRTERWKQFVFRTGNWHSKFRDLLRNLTLLPQGGRGTSGLCEVTEAARAVRELVETMRFSELPQKMAESQQLADVAALRNVAEEVGKAFDSLPTTEYRRVRQQADDIDRLCRNRAPAAFLIEVQEKIVTRVLDHLPLVAPQLVSEWSKTYTSLKDRGYLADDERSGGARVLAFLEAAEDDDPSAEMPPAMLLTRLQDAPAAELNDIRDVLARADKLLIALRDAVHAQVQGMEDDCGTLADIHSAGARLIATADAMVGAGANS